MAAARRRIASRRSWPANLYLNSKGYYWYRNPADGSVWGLGREFKEAAAQARVANAELERRKGAVGLIQRIDGADDTLIVFCDEYEKIYTERGNTRKSVMTVQTYLRTIKKAPFAQTSISKITPKQVADYIAAEEKRVSGSHSSQIQTRLIDIFNEAIGAGKLEAGKNPAIAIRRRKSVVKRERLSLDEFKKIVAKARENLGMSWAARAFLLALLTGQRREDIKKMKFSDIKDGFLWVEQSKSKGQTKLKIPVTLGLAALDGLTIEEVIRECRDAILSKHVIHHVMSKGTAKPGDSPKLGGFTTAFVKFRELAEIETTEGKTPPSFHEIRSLAARLYGNERGADFAQALLGHKNAQMTALYRDSRGTEWSEVKVG
ncbi:tyrosine-type recombinase/integrase [Paraburkholderia nodosa]|uniref:tyrosine-type recombinase/integrase n=1 Tax=Paraburkholderia nodosa TaxID=392320 RepID=UPI0008422094|nr:tyrosine-type recombinase/integrase [Paraburkholderia nodosa]